VDRARPFDLTLPGRDLLPGTPGLHVRTKPSTPVSSFAGTTGGVELEENNFTSLASRRPPGETCGQLLFAAGESDPNTAPDAHERIEIRAG
jgi:hypothetical protein